MKAFNLNSAGCVKLAFGFKVGLVGLFFGFKRAKATHNAANLKVSNPVVSVLMNAKEPRPATFLRLPLVLDVFFSGYIAKVGNPVVVPNAVDVVDFVLGPSAMHVQPRKTVGSAIKQSELDANVPVSIACASHISILHRIDGRFLPSKYTGFQTVVQFGLDALKRYLALCGFNVQRKIGNSVIRSVFVQPNNLFAFWQNPVSVEPSQKVGIILSVVNADANVAATRNNSSPLSSSFVFSSVDTPSKDSRLGVVVNKFSQAFCGKIVSSHDALLSLIGERLGGVGAPFGLRYLNIRGA